MRLPILGAGQAVAKLMQNHWKLTCQGVIIGCLLSIIAYWNALASLVGTWNSSQTYQYSWLVLPFLVYLLGWHERTNIRYLRPHPDGYGIFVAFLAALGWLAADLINIDLGRQLAFILGIHGVVMAALGWRAYGRLAPPLYLMFFMIPSGDLLQPILRPLTVKVIEIVALVFHLPYKIEGFFIIIGQNEYIVLNECSGLAYVLLATFLGYSFGLMLYRSALKICGLALFCGALGFLANALRVGGIVLIDWFSGTQMPLSAHSNVQWVALLVCFGLLFFVLSKLQTEPTGTVGDAKDFPMARHLVTAPVLAGILALAITSAISWLQHRQSQALIASNVNSLPHSIADWQLQLPNTLWVANRQNETRLLTLNYQKNGKQLTLQVLEPIAQHAKLLESETAPGSKNLWHDNHLDAKNVCAFADCISLSHTVWEETETELRKDVYSTFALGNTYTTSALRLRLMSAWARLSASSSPPRLIWLTYEGDPKIEIDNLAIIFRSLQSALEQGN